MAEGIAGQIQLRGRFLRGKNAQGLALQVDAASVYQTKILHIAVELLRTQAQPVGDEGRVAGVARRLLQGLMSVAGAIAAMDGGVQHMDGARAVKGGVLVNDPLLQGRRQGQHLEGRAGLIGVVDGPVAPLAQLGIRQIQLTVLHQGCKPALIDGGGIVQIIGGAGGHGQDRPGLHIHDDARSPLSLGGGHHLAQGLLHIVLHCCVQRQHNVASVLCFIVLLIAVEHVAARGILGGHHQARLAVQYVVIPGLQSIQAIIIRAHKADDLGGQRGIGVIALGIGDHIHAHNALVVDEGADLIGHILLHPKLEYLILGVRALHFFQDALLVDLQDLRELLCHAVLSPGNGIILVAESAVHFQRGEKYRFRRGGNGHDVAVAVIDRTPGGGNLRAAGLLVQSLSLQLVVAQDLQRKELDDQDQKYQHT